jgi:fluoroquinolone transport system permease protein
MRVRALLAGDVRTQYKYGFYLLYLFLSMFYIGLLYALPAAWREKAAILMIFSDPAAMGLYFMGAIVLFEKSERVLSAIAVSPVKPREYVLSKLCSIGIVSAAAGLVIGLSSGVIRQPFSCAAGVFLCSCLFSAAGLMIACKTSTLNQFAFATVPAELLINLPALYYLFWNQDRLLLLHPGCAMIELCTGGNAVLPALLSLLLWSALIFFLASRVAGKMFQSVGGIKL